jgi:putative DNA methylase
MIKAPKKLIEVALPLDDINTGAAYEKLPGIGPHPRGIHHWWARRPFAAARAILFAQLVNDPGGERGWGSYAGQTKEDALKEREELFTIIRGLADWKQTNNKILLKQAHDVIQKSWRETCELNKGKPGFDPDKLPAFHDPFAGGGAIPLEAQRLGLEAYASDLNPVAVMINKAMIEIPPKFAGKAPVGPIPDGEQSSPNVDGGWTGAKGLAEDVRRYGHWMRKEAEKRIGHLYPKIKITEEMAKERPDLEAYVGRELTVIAWLWARTVKSPNPAYAHMDVPLVSNFMLSTKKGKEAYVEPVVEGDSYRFEVRVGKPKDMEAAKKGTKLGRGAKFRCVLSDAPIAPDYIKSEGRAGRMGARLMAIVAEGDRSRVYLDPTNDMVRVAHSAEPSWKPETPIPNDPRALWTPPYGLTTFGDLFTPRQLVALNTFSDLVQEARERVIADAKRTGLHDDGVGLDAGGSGATAYGDALATFLSFSINRCADFNNSLTGWNQSNEKIMHLFNRQAIPMVWDYGECNIIEDVVGGFSQVVNFQAKCIKIVEPRNNGFAIQCQAQDQRISSGKIISTDPPYYDNIGYADLSDFFYTWLRRALKDIFKDIFLTISVPKSAELVATPYRHNGKDNAELFFMNGMRMAMLNLATNSHSAFPATIYYAFKQSETKDIGTASAGWESFLEAVVQSGFLISGTWPLRSEQTTRMIGMGTNALASSIVLVCRKRDKNAPSIPRRQFLRELKEELPEALEAMIGGKKGASPIAPVDLAQAAIGPGMAVFSRYSGIIEADGSKMSVHDALIQINKVIDEFFNEAEGDMDSDTRFCIDWFMQYGFKQAEYGQADVLARAKGTTVEGLAVAGVVETGGGKVRLLKFEEYPENWDPEKDTRTPTWEALHQLIRALRSGGEEKAGLLLKKMAERTESIRQLAYRLYTLCERKGWAEEARAYNELIASWHGTIEAVDQAGGNSRREKHLTFDM